MSDVAAGAAILLAVAAILLSAITLYLIVLILRVEALLSRFNRGREHPRDWNGRPIRERL